MEKLSGIMQAADQTVLSLRPGGGGGGNRSRVPRFEASFTNSDLPLLRPHGVGGGSSVERSIKTGDSRFEGRERIKYTRDQLLQLREVVINISDDILLIKQEVESELFGEDGSRGRADTNVQSQTRYSEPDSRDWRSKSSQFSSPQRTDGTLSEKTENLVAGKNSLTHSLRELTYLPAKGEDLLPR